MPQPIRSEDLWKLARLSQPSLSPDGAQVACTVTEYDVPANKGRASLWLLNTLGGAPRRLTQCGERDGDAQWSPDGRSIAFLARREGLLGKDSAPQLYLMPPDGGEARRLTDLATGVSAARWFPDGKKLAFISWVWPDLKGAKKQAARLQEQQASKVKAHVVEHTTYRFWDHWLSDGRVPHLFVVDVDSGRCRDLFEKSPYQLTLADPGRDHYAIAPDGREICFCFNPDADKLLTESETLMTVQVGSGKVRALLPRTRRTRWAPSYSPDGRWLAFLEQDLARSAMPPTEIRLLDRASGAVRRLARDWDRDAAGPLAWSAESDALHFIAEDAARAHVWRLGLADKQPQVVLRGGAVTEFALAGDTLVAMTSHMGTAALAVTCSLSEGAGAAPRRIENFNDTVMANIRLGRVEEMIFAGWNNEPVQAWITYPPDFDDNKKWPLLHIIHGGPHMATTDGVAYRWNNHAFAAAGYVVVQVNYHGSASWGADFMESIEGLRGTKEHVDIEAATDVMLARGFIDPERMVATGGSYGGFMVAFMNSRNGAKKGGDRYKAYVCHAGILDWMSKFADDSFIARARQLGGFYWDDPERIAKQNPLAMAAHLNTPTLVVHGLLDYRVPDSQGLMYYNTLKARGVPTRLVYFEEENHWILKPQNSLLWYREVLGWVNRFAPGGGRKAGR
jgi:dipeptidyl aminopeptidase/acylaminoacyl peptidase